MHNACIPTITHECQDSAWQLLHKPYGSLLGMGAGDQIASLSVMIGSRRFTTYRQHALGTC